MWHEILFWTLFLGASSYALLRGGEPERLVAAIYVLGVVATQVVMPPIADRHRGVDLAPLAVDVILAVAFVPVAMRSRRYWPLWIATLQFFQVASRFEPLLPGGSVRVAYGFLLSIWGFAILPILGIGTLRHRIRLGRGLDERPWVG
jgi:hypothetical protein